MTAGVIQRQLKGSLATVGFYILRCTTLEHAAALATEAGQVFYVADADGQGNDGMYRWDGTAMHRISSLGGAGQQVGADPGETGRQFALVDEYTPLLEYAYGNLVWYQGTIYWQSDNTQGVVGGTAPNDPTNKWMPVAERPLVRVVSDAGATPAAQMFGVWDPNQFATNSGGFDVIVGGSRIGVHINHIDENGVDRTALITSLRDGDVLTLDDGLGTVSTFDVTAVEPETLGGFFIHGTLHAVGGAMPTAAWTLTLARGGHRDDVFVNTTDKAAWIYADDNGTGSPGWVQFHAKSSPQVTVASATGSDPTKLTTTPERDDLFINTADENSWVYASDDGSGAPGWVPLSSKVERPTVTVSSVKADTPITHITPMGEWTYTQPAPTGNVADGTIEVRSPGTAAAVVFFHADLAGTDRSAELATIKTGDVVRVRDTATMQNGWDVAVATAQHAVNQPPGSEDLLLINGATTPVGTTPPDGTPMSVQIPTSALVPERDDVFVNIADESAWVFDGTDWRAIGVPSGGAPGAVLSRDAAGGLAWTATVSGAVLRGVIAAAATEPHEYTWATLTADLALAAPGSYYIVDHLDSPPAWVRTQTYPSASMVTHNGQTWEAMSGPLTGIEPGTSATWREADYGRVPSGVTGAAGKAVRIGDWMVAIDSDNDGTSDTFHVVSHDQPNPMPPTVGHHVGDVLTVEDPRTGTYGWQPVAPSAPPATILTGTGSPPSTAPNGTVYLQYV